VLQAFRSLYAPLEQAWSARRSRSPSCPTSPSGARPPGSTRTSPRSAPPVPSDLDVPPLTTVEDVAGACYVLEGATLGRRGRRPRAARTSRTASSRRTAAAAARCGPASAGTCARSTSAGVDEARTVASARRTFGLFERACA
jgi:hypothetical protein